MLSNTLMYIRGRYAIYNRIETKILKYSFRETNKSNFRNFWNVILKIEYKFNVYELKDIIY